MSSRHRTMSNQTTKRIPIKWRILPPTVYSNNFSLGGFRVQIPIKLSYSPSGPGSLFLMGSGDGGLEADLDSGGELLQVPAPPDLPAGSQFYFSAQ
jgi:hypothetical protein